MNWKRLKDWLKDILVLPPMDVPHKQNRIPNTRGRKEMKLWLKLVIVVWQCCVVANILIAHFGLGFIPITDSQRTKLLLEQGNTYMISFYLIGFGVFGLGVLLFSLWSRYIFIDQDWRKKKFSQY